MTWPWNVITAIAAIPLIVLAVAWLCVFAIMAFGFVLVIHDAIYFRYKKFTVAAAPKAART